MKTTALVIFMAFLSLALFAEKDNAARVDITIAPYKVLRTMSVPRYTITKVSKTDSNIRIRFIRAGVENSEMSEPLMISTSGTEYNIGSNFGISYPTFPVDVKINFSAWNFFLSSTHQVIFEFTINEPGTWDVSISY